MKEVQEFSSDYEKYLNGILWRLRFRFKEVSVNRYKYLCEFHFDGSTTKVKHETLKEAMLKNKFPKSITNLLK